jgi:hypothetical protein
MKFNKGFAAEISNIAWMRPMTVRKVRAPQKGEVYKCTKVSLK